MLALKNLSEHNIIFVSVEFRLRPSAIASTPLPCSSKDETNDGDERD